MILLYAFDQNHDLCYQWLDSVILEYMEVVIIDITSFFDYLYMLTSLHIRYFLTFFKAIPLRLQGPQSVNGTGRVEIFYQGEWGTICDNNYWSIVDANVACRQLGYQYAVRALLGYDHDNHGSGKIWLDNVQCTGREQNLSSCGHRRWGIHECIHLDDAGVECSSTGVVTIIVVMLISFRFYLFGSTKQTWHDFNNLISTIHLLNKI